MELLCKHPRANAQPTGMYAPHMQGCASRATALSSTPHRHASLTITTPRVVCHAGRTMQASQFAPQSTWPSLSPHVPHAMPANLQTASQHRHALPLLHRPPVLQYYTGIDRSLWPAGPEQRVPVASAARSILAHTFTRRATGMIHAMQLWDQ